MVKGQAQHFWLILSTVVSSVLEKMKEIWQSRMTTTSKRQTAQVKLTQRHCKNVRLHNDYGPTYGGQLQSSNRVWLIQGLSVQSFHFLQRLCNQTSTKDNTHPRRRGHKNLSQMLVAVSVISKVSSDICKSRQYSAQFVSELRPKGWRSPE